MIKSNNGRILKLVPIFVCNCGEILMVLIFLFILVFGMSDFVGAKSNLKEAKDTVQKYMDEKYGDKFTLISCESVNDIIFDCSDSNFTFIYTDFSEDAEIGIQMENDVIIDNYKKTRIKDDMEGIVWNDLNDMNLNISEVNVRTELIETEKQYFNNSYSANCMEELPYYDDICRLHIQIRTDEDEEGIEKIKGYVEDTFVDKGIYSNVDIICDKPNNKWEWIYIEIKDDIVEYSE